MYKCVAFIQLLYVQMVQQYICVHVCYCHWSWHVHYVIGYMWIDCIMHLYVDAAKLWVTTMLLFISYNITTADESKIFVNVT